MHFRARNRTWRRYSVCHIPFTCFMVLVLTLSGSAMAKPGGCAADRKGCRAVFEVDDLGGEVEMYFQGTGFAAFSNVPNYDEFDIQEALKSDTVSMHWETIALFSSTLQEELGIVQMRARPHESTVTLVSADASKQSIFPAIGINSLFVEVEFPKLGLVAFNKEPIIMRADGIRNPTHEEIAEDTRYKANPRGVPKAIKQLLAKKEFFDPNARFQLVRSVKFFDKKNPDKVVATLRRAEVVQQLHYGLDVELLSIKEDGQVVSAQFGVTNISGADDEFSWYVDDSHGLTVISNQEGRTRIKAGERIEVNVQAFNNDPTRPLGHRSCIFLGVTNLPEMPDKKQPCSGFIVVSKEEFDKFRPNR
jgi:hypothetical protein